jgi:bifunctional isochorismate lyase / aryl carrier protein
MNRKMKGSDRMAIPPISAYPMPSASDLPQNKVAWRPDPGRAVLLIHDMQQYFVTAFEAGQSPVKELIANIQLLKSRCLQLGIPVIYSAQPGGQAPEKRGLQQDFWGKGMDDGPVQKEIVNELAPSGQDIVLTKWRYSAFQKTNLDDILRQYHRDQIMITGIYAHIGCLMTATEAFMKDIQPFFVADALGDFSLEYHKMALTYAAERCAVTMLTAPLIDELEATNGTAMEGAQAQSGKMAAAQMSIVDQKLDESASTAKASKSATAEKEVTAVPQLTEQLVREQVAGLLQESPEGLAADDNLMDRGMDSIRMMSLVEKWRRYGAKVTFVELAERPTLADWWKLLSSQTSQVLPNLDYFSL